MSEKKTNRRDFLFTATYAVGAVGVGATIWPMIDQMNPDASVKALASTEVDVSAVNPGKTITVLWRGKPVFIRRRTPDEIAEADSLSDLLDQSEIKESSSYKTSLPTSMNLSGTYKAKDWAVLDGNIRLDLGDYYWASKKPLISLGSEFFPNTNVSLYFGISIGGENSFAWGTGLSFKMGSVILDLSGGQLGGIFNNATGMQFGFGLRIQK